MNYIDKFLVGAAISLTLYACEGRDSSEGHCQGPCPTKVEAMNSQEYEFAGCMDTDAGAACSAATPLLTMRLTPDKVELNYLDAKGKEQTLKPSAERLEDIELSREEFVDLQSKISTLACDPADPTDVGSICLNVGESAYLDAHTLIKLVSLSDLRCPKDMECVQDGPLEAGVVLSRGLAKLESTLAIDSTNPTRNVARLRFLDLEIRFDHSMLIGQSSIRLTSGKAAEDLTAPTLELANKVACVMGEKVNSYFPLHIEWRKDSEILLQVDALYNSPIWNIFPQGDVDRKVSWSTAAGSKTTSDGSVSCGIQTNIPTQNGTLDTSRVSGYLICKQTNGEDLAVNFSCSRN